MGNVFVYAGELVIEVTGWRQFCAFRMEIRVPVGSVTGLRAAPELVEARPRGLRAPGLGWPFRPGPAFVGSWFRGRDNWEFWSVVRPKPEQLVEITVAPGERAGKYRRFVVQVEDAAALVTKETGRLTSERRRYAR